MSEIEAKIVEEVYMEFLIDGHEVGSWEDFKSGYVQYLRESAGEF